MNTPLLTLDLAKQAPHSPRARTGGFVIALRAADKCRALLAGTPGDYVYDCPLDNMLFSFKGITGVQFQSAVQAATNCEEIGAWLQANGTGRTAGEIQAWSNQVEASSLLREPAKRSYFIERCSELGLNPQMNTTFDWLEADDRESLRRASRQHPVVPTDPGC